MGSLEEQCDRVRGDFKQNRLALPIFVCVCKDLQELETIYRTAVKTTCIRGSLKKTDVLAQRLMLKLVPKFRKIVLDTVYDGFEIHIKRFPSFLHFFCH